MIDQPLIEDPDLYFVRTPGAKLLPLELLSPNKPAASQPASVDRAEQLMRDAAAGRCERRAPITVRRQGDGYVIVDGNATFAVAERHGWAAILTTEET
jgi:hypothetical protein